MRGKKSTLITTLAVIITVVSLVSCFGVLGISNSVQGVSIQEKKVWNVAIDNLSNLAMDEGAIEVIKEPTLDKIKFYDFIIRTLLITKKLYYILKLM